MPRREQRPPTTAHKITTYQELREFARAFANGDIPLLVVMSTPGVGKSQTIKAATEGIRTLTIKGRKSAIDFHTDSYHYQDDPVVLDDADSMLGDRLCRSYIKMLTETDQYKRIDYGTKTKILEREGVPKSFFTTSPVCILTNHWDSGDVILNAIESRAEFVHFVPAWDEVYRYIGGWFWDQEIFDYLYNRLEFLKDPDIRIIIKAWNRKKSGLSSVSWQKVIDGHLSDPELLLVKRLMDDDSIPKSKDKALRFSQQTGKSRATYFRIQKEIRERGWKKPKRIVLERTEPPSLERPDDGPLSDEDE